MVDNIYTLRIDISVKNDKYLFATQYNLQEIDKSIYIIKYALYKIIHKMGYNPILPWLGGLSNFLKENSYINESSYSYKFIKKYSIFL